MPSDFLVIAAGLAVSLIMFYYGAVEAAFGLTLGILTVVILYKLQMNNLKQRGLIR